MNMLIPTLTIIEPWQASLYMGLAKPVTLAALVREVEHFDTHRTHLHARGDTAAVAGLRTPMRLCLLKLAAVQAKGMKILQRKVKVLAIHRAIWVDEPQTAALIDAAIVADASALGLTLKEQAQLRRSLWGEP